MKEEGVSGSSQDSDFIMEENKHETAFKGESMIKEEDLEMCEQAEQAINAAIRAVETATEVVFKIKIQANELISVDDVTDPLLFAVKYCRDSKEALEKSTDFWQEILGEREELLGERDEILETKESAKDEEQGYADINDEVSMNQDDFEMLPDHSLEMDMIVGDIIKKHRVTRAKSDQDKGDHQSGIVKEVANGSDEYDQSKDYTDENAELEDVKQIAKDEPVTFPKLKLQPVCTNTKNCKCDICILTISQKPARHKYLQYVREVNGNHECIFCNISLPTKKFNRMREHIKMKHLLPPGKKFSCDKCDFVHEYEQKVTEHNDAVHKGITYPCTWQGCSHRSNRQRNLKKHVDTVHLKQIPNLSCKWCAFTTKQSRTLKKHVMETHPDNDDKFYCDECMFVAMNSKSLSAHIAKTHTFPGKARHTLWVYDEAKQVYKCKECTFITSHQSSVYTHFKHRHQKEKYLCDKCDFTTAGKSNLNYHYEDKHSDQILKCDSCDFTTPQKSTMKKHIRKHEGKAIACEYEGCNHLANFKSDLQIHINAVHKKIRHHCPECNFSANRQGDLNRHVMKIHGNKAGVIYSCDWCIFKTVNEKFLTSHMQEKHDISPGFTPEQGFGEPQSQHSVKEDLDSSQLS